MNYHERDITFKHPFTALVAGPTGSGKTVLVRRILGEHKRLISNCPSNKIIWAYGQNQDLYQVSVATVDITYVCGLPAEELIDSIKPTIIIIDDLMNELGSNKELANLFTKGSHHKNISIIFIVQNVFHQAREMRTISLNCHYLILLKNPRDKAQIYSLARQIEPMNVGFVVESYKKATSSPFGYLVIDNKIDTPDILRLRSNIFSKFPTVYVVHK